MVYQKAVENKKKFVIWGCGNYLNLVIDRLSPDIDILFACDNNDKKWGLTITERKIKCVSPDQLRQLEDIVVLIAVQDKHAIREIEEELEGLHIPYCHINEAVKAYRTIYENAQIEKYESTMGRLREPEGRDLLKCFISVSVPVQACQLKCTYCYIGQTGGFENIDVVLPSAEFIRKALSRKRLGGTALINFCGAGETLLCRELFHIVQELLEEGHYISIITNALLSGEIDRYLRLSIELRKRLFFKCSFHYRQLKERNLLEAYSRNVNQIWKSGASISVELVPEDELVPQIPEISKFCMEHFGALPHITVARDESQTEMPIITEYDEEEYKNIWGQFMSPMFELKMNQMKKRTEYCTAGKNTFLFSLESGRISPCPGEKDYFNIYEDISQNIPYREIGFACSSPYCRNAHAYLALGIVKKVNCGTYLQVRDRLTGKGENWVNPEMATIFAQRICDNQEGDCENSEQANSFFSG
ncbi:MAG: radical SAM protein [Lachnospiraceae bacterium]|nr:radical SAM protein [Lachnospiraceae bacterium]